MMGDEGVAKIIDLGAFNAGNSEIPVNCGSDVADKKRPAGFGDK